MITPLPATLDGTSDDRPVIRPSFGEGWRKLKIFCPVVFGYHHRNPKETLMVYAATYDLALGEAIRWMKTADWDQPDCYYTMRAITIPALNISLDRRGNPDPDLEKTVREHFVGCDVKRRRHRVQHNI